MDRSILSVAAFTITRTYGYGETLDWPSATVYGNGQVPHMLRIMLALWSFVLITLAVARITRLVTTDQITSSIRRWIVHKYGEGSPPAYLVHCPYCIGFWLSLLGTVLWLLTSHPSPWLWGPAWFAMAYLVAPILLRIGGD